MAQKANSQGIVRYLVSSDWAKMFSALDYMSQQQKDRQMYVWGSRSEWKAYYNLYFTEDKSKFERSEEAVEADDVGWSSRKTSNFFIHDFENSTSNFALTMESKQYQIIDSTQKITWKILNDIKDVAGEICMNAMYYDSIKQQKIIAWFALNIPNNSGPERFVGLPGLILEVNINNGAKVFTADKITYAPVEPKELEPGKFRSKKITFAEYNKIVDKEIKDSKKAFSPWFWKIPY